MAAEGIAAQRVPRLRGWLVRLASVGDLEARAERAGAAVFHRGRYALPPPPYAPPVRIARATVAPPAEAVGQLDLFDVEGVPA